MYLYPKLHPHYHQSQVDFSNPNVDLFPEFPNGKGYEVIVKPGDLMYIPPYWFHRVEVIKFKFSFFIF